MRAVVIATLLALASADHIADVAFEPHVPTRGGVQPVLGRIDDRIDSLEAAFEVLEQKEPSFDRSEWVVSDRYQTAHNGIEHIYMRQYVHGLEVTNSEVNVNVKDGQVLSFYSSAFTHQSDVSLQVEFDQQRILRPEEAVAQFAKSLGRNYELQPREPSNEMHAGLDRATNLPGLNFALESIPTHLALTQVDDGEHALLVWEMHVTLEDNDFDVCVDAHNGEIISVIDWVKELLSSRDHFVPEDSVSVLPGIAESLLGAKTSSVGEHSYKGYTMPGLDPTLGDQNVHENPADPDNGGSDLGWHNQGSGILSTTIGNNVYAQENLRGGSSWENNYRPGPSDGPDQHYLYDVDLTKQPPEYQDASITNLFYWNNMVHDIFYAVGFDEVSGNFQETNFGRGGREVDAVQANALDGAGRNNANFRTPPDGQRPRMRMYEWTASPVNRDGDIDSGIIVHEYAHGISNRLTGGPSNVGCLGSGQSGGMGEGWGDCFAIWFMQTKDSDPTREWPMGIYAAGRGIRKYPYTTDMSINLHKYSDINPLSQVHAMGCVWCSILYEVYWQVVDESGFDDDWYTGDGGNNKILRDVVDGMKLQPCRPSFMQARDAILLADEQNYDGENVCAIWRGFAKRGLGFKAEDRSSGSRNNVVDDYSVPPECE